jgi:membrane protease YdiL (CAAX protease family)
LLSTSSPASVPWSVADSFWAAAFVVVVRGGLAIVSRLIHGEWMQLPSSAGGGLVSVLAAAVLLLAPLYVFAIRRGALPRDFGFTGFAFWPAVGMIGRGWLVWMAVALPWGLLMLRFGTRMQPNMLRVFGAGWRAYVLALIFGAMVAPLTEETFFRGFLFAGLRQRFSLWTAAGISGLLFGLIHFMPLALPPLTLYGIIFAWLRERTGSLWPAILMHMLVNAGGFTIQFAADRLG